MSTITYLDHNATTPVHPDLKTKVLDWLDLWGNPSSIHLPGRAPKALIRDARLAVARLIKAEPLEIIFTSGGSEANNQAIKGLVATSDQAVRRSQILVSAVEHPSAKQTVMALKQRGFEVKVIPVSRHGEVDLQAFKDSLSEKTALVCIMLANNETGHIFPVKQMTELAHSVGAKVHCDAVQALGKMPVDIKALGVDTASFSGHKFYALKGCGVLYVRKGLNFESLIQGGSQERGRRAGTENTLSIASLGYMAATYADVEPRAEKLRALRDQLEDELLARIANIEITGRKNERLPNTTHLTISGIDGETLLINLDIQGFAVSTGAACSSGSPEPSPVLLAMGLTREEAQSSLRLSLGWQTSADDLKRFVNALEETVTRLREFRMKKSSGESFAYGP